MYSLFYNPAIAIEQLTPVLSLDECLAGANIDNLAYQINLVRLNWMVDDLKQNPLQKPFLIDCGLKIVTGDTRYMAIQFHKNITHVPALMTAKSAPANWMYIRDKKELGELLNIDPEDIITNYDWQEKSLDWIEFAFYGPACDHMHDESQRKRMIENYLTVHPDTVFDYDWVSEKIDWSLYDH